MSSNFEFLRTGWKPLAIDAAEVERSAYVAPRTAVFYARRTLERAVKWMYRNDCDLKPPYQDNLAALIHEQTFKDTLAPGLFDKARVIYKLGNLAVHSEKPISQYDGLQVTRCLYAFLSFIAKIYSETPPLITAFDEQLISKQTATAAGDKSAAQLSALANKLKDKDKILEKEQLKSARLRTVYDTGDC